MSAKVAILKKESAMLNSVYFDIAGPQALFAGLGLGAVALIV
jgi:hypothetical protein